VVFPGLALTPVPWFEGGPLQPWDGIADFKESRFLCRHEFTGKWFELWDYFLARRTEFLTQEE
jgi:hypothetical protein